MFCITRDHSIITLSQNDQNLDAPSPLVWESPKTMRKLCLSTKFPHQEIRWNYGILRSEVKCKEKVNWWWFKLQMQHEPDYPSQSILHLAAAVQTIFDHNLFIFLRDHIQISFLISSELINFHFPWIHQKNHWFSDNFRGNRSLLIRLNSIHIRSETSRVSDSGWRLNKWCKNITSTLIIHSIILVK